MQQYLPFTVLKLINILTEYTDTVATVLTVYGIETKILQFQSSGSSKFVATVLTVYGIETVASALDSGNKYSLAVATVLTVYGIETF